MRRTEVDSSKSKSEEGYAPRQLCFLTKSAEAIEKKQLGLFEDAKKCKRVRKELKRKGIDRRHVGTSAGLNVPTSRGGGYPPSQWIVLKTKKLREEHFVSG
jgi:hypothetical protein